MPTPSNNDSLKDSPLITEESLKNAINDRDFTYDYVMRVTFEHIVDCVNTSISKTLRRLPEFTGNSEKSLQLLTTLYALNQLLEHLPHIKEKLWKPPTVQKQSQIDS